MVPLPRGPSPGAASARSVPTVARIRASAVLDEAARTASMKTQSGGDRAGGRQGLPLRRARPQAAQRLGDATVLGTTLRHAIASHLRSSSSRPQPFAELARRSVAARDVVVLPEVGSDGAVPLGMGYSIAAGVGARARCGRLAVLPGDMPLVQPRRCRRSPRQLDAPPGRLRAAPGPARASGRLCGRALFRAGRLSGDEGARRLVARYPAFGLEVDDPGVLVDIDTEADLERLRTRRPRPPTPRSAARGRERAVTS